MAAGGSYTTSAAFLEALAEAGVRYIFANLGSDHPGLIEALARADAQGREDDVPRLIVCPHETVALSAAHAYLANEVGELLEHQAGQELGLGELLGAELVPVRGEGLAGRLVGDLEHPARGFAGLHTS